MLGRAAEIIARRLPFDRAMRLIALLFAEQGFGAGAHVETSGEANVFSLIASPAPLLVDVGGHAGAYSEAFLSRFPNGSALLVEPSQAHLALARERLAGRKVDFLGVALSDSEGEADLYKDKAVSGLASLTRRRLSHHGIDMALTERVQCRTLDGIVAERSIAHIDLLKIDVEGHELAVLHGGAKTIDAGVVDRIQFEFGGCNLDTRTTLQDFFYFFQTAGFVLHVVGPRALNPIREYNELYEHYRTTNFLAIRTPRSA